MLHIVRGLIKLIDKNGAYIDSTNPVPVSQIGAIEVTQPLTIQAEVDTLYVNQEVDVFNAFQEIIKQLKMINLRLEAMTDEQITKADVE